MARQTGSDRAEAPYFAEEVRRQLISLFGAEQLYGGGLSVRTSLDPRLQALADQALREGLEALDRRQGWRGPLGRLSLRDDIDDQLRQWTDRLPPGRLAALVLQVSDRRGGDLCGWAAGPGAV